jgi:hypothetical protein
MDPCDVHVSLSDLSMSASLGLMMCLPPKIHVAAISSAELACTSS